jgi:mannose/cellobiose epimerase-like protein (N-acyl-D-glucosamine 2-epimerase family)
VTPAPSESWLANEAHRSLLVSEAQRLLAFYQYRSIDPSCGFFELRADGSPSAERSRHLVWTTRMVYCFSLGALLGRPGAAVVVDHGLRTLAERFRDRRHGGHYWIVDASGPVDRTKQAYGLAHLLLAGAAATFADRPGGRELLDDAVGQLEERFWSEDDGLVVEEFEEDWRGPGAYRGANSNMHLVEGLLAAAEAAGEPVHVERARVVAERLIRERTAANDWRVAEHYTTDWEIDREYNRDDPENIFRPYGSIIGHWFEWARLLLQVRSAARPEGDWMVDAAERLFRKAVDEGWDGRRGGLVYTVDFGGQPLNRERYWWPVAEAIAAAAYLEHATGDAYYERWYRTFWDFADEHLVDHERGGWQHTLDAENRPTFSVYEGKVDVFHALHAYLLPLLPKDELPAAALAHGRFRS